MFLLKYVTVILKFNQFKCIILLHHFFFFICIFSTQKILTHVFEGGKNQLNYIVQFLSVKFIYIFQNFEFTQKKLFGCLQFSSMSFHGMLFFVYFTITYLVQCIHYFVNKLKMNMYFLSKYIKFN